MEEIFDYNDLINQYKNPEREFDHNFNKNMIGKNISKQIAKDFLESQKKLGIEGVGKILDLIAPDNIDDIVKKLNMNQEDFKDFLVAINIYKIRKDFNQSMSILQQLSSKYPDNISVLYYQGVIYNDFDRTDDAISCFEDILDIDPDNYEAKMGIANSMMLSGDYQEALLYYNNISQQYNKLDSILFTGVTYNLMGNHLQAINIFDEIEKNNPDFDIDGYKGYTYFLLGNYEQAAKYYLNNVSKQSANIESMYMLGKIYNLTGELYKADHFLSNSLDLSQKEVQKPLLLDIFFELGMTYFKFTEYQVAMKYFDYIIKMDPSDIDSYVYKANCLINLGKIQAAKDLILQAIQENGDEDELLDILRHIEKM